MSDVNHLEMRRTLNGERGSTKTRTLILEHALKMASLSGIEGLTIGELAKSVGMSKSGLFAHFQGKDNLQLSVLKLAVERFVDSVLKPSFREPRGEPRVRALFRNWLAHLDEANDRPGGSILISASIELDDRPGALRDFVQRAQWDMIANVEKAAKLAVEEGDFREDLDCGLFAWSVYSFVLGYHHSKRMLQDPRAEEHVKRSFQGLILVSRVNKSVSGQPSKSVSGQPNKSVSGQPSKSVRQRSRPEKKSERRTKKLESNAKRKLNLK